MKIGTLIAVSLVLAICASVNFSQTVPSDAPAKLISAPPFQISAEDEARGIDGTMKLAVDIDKAGNVKRAVVYMAPSWPCTGDLDLRVDAVMRAAEKAVLGFKFSPAINKGKPVGSQAAVKLVIGLAARKLDEPTPIPPKGPPSESKIINGGVVNGKAISLPKPEYPAAARVAGVSGSVKVQVLIDEMGKVVTAQAIEGPPQLQFAARAAACGARFTPTLLQGQPVKVAGIIVYNFVA
jgi:TonB family protein